MVAYQEIFEKFPDGVTLHDPDDGSLLETNQQFCDMLGYTREELLELDFDDLHPDEPPYTSKRAASYIRTAASEGPQTFEWVDETKDGDRLPVEVTLRQTTIGGEQRVLAIVRDITDRMQREEELERKNERLEEFASVVSHDLQNPLMVAKGNVELLQEDLDHERLETVAYALGRMESLTDDLLDLARTGDETLDIETVEFPDTVEGCWQTLATDDASLILEMDQRTIKADESRLLQLLENLIRNAVEHAGPDVTVRVGTLSDGFYVADDGPGIPVDERDAVFETGYTTKDSGTGVGLDIVEQVVAEHEWAIDVTDSESGGARFEITGVDSPS